MNKIQIASSLFALVATTQLGAQTTLLHYRVNDGDDLTSGVPNLSTTADPNLGVLTPALATPTVTLSEELPPANLGVPPTAGNRSLSFVGDQGIVLPGTLQLLNSEVFDAGGFTYEAWVRYGLESDTGEFIDAGNINSIIDYSGSEKLRRVAADEVISMVRNSASIDDLISAAPGEWHYVAVVFEATSQFGASINGSYRFYVDDTVEPAATVEGVTITGFSDGQDFPTIAVGMHPGSFSGDFFNGIIYEPRVTLGTLEPSQLLFFSTDTVITTVTDEDDGDLDVTNGDGISLREAITYAATNSTIIIPSTLNGQTINLTHEDGQLAINKNLIIDATRAPDGITINADTSATDRHRLMFIDTDSTVSLINLNLTGGWAPDGNTDSSGGAIFASSGSNVTITGCALYDNQIGDGDGGGAIFADANSTVSLDNCTLSNNRTGSGEGGGAILANGDSTLTINHTTISGNQTAGMGGGILALDTANITVTDSIIAGNTANGTASEVEGTIDTETGNNFLTGDPVLAPIAAYGGPTLTMLPLPGSPVIDMATSSTRTTDQRGFAPIDARDIGAVEAPDWSNIDRANRVAIWNTDFDEDGSPYGVEFALNTNPFASDPGNPGNLAISFNGDGQPVLNFGYNEDAVDISNWILERSDDLTATSWDIIVQSSDPIGPSEITDLTVPIDTRQFYRFRAEIIEPTP